MLPNKSTLEVIFEKIDLQRLFQTNTKDVIRSNFSLKKQNKIIATRSLIRNEFRRNMHMFGEEKINSLRDK